MKTKAFYDCPPCPICKEDVAVSKFLNEKTKKTEYYCRRCHKQFKDDKK